MASRHQQRGLTLISWAIVIAVVAFFAVVGMKSLPIYLNHFKVVSIMNNVAQQPSASEMSPNELKETFMRRFDIDMVSGIHFSDIKRVTNKGGQKALSLKYERRVHMFYNVDAVYVFDENVPIGN